MGDEITLTLRDIPETHVGYITSGFKDSYDTYPTKTLTLSIVGIYGTLSPNPVQLTSVTNYLYIPGQRYARGLWHGRWGDLRLLLQLPAELPCGQGDIPDGDPPGLLELGLDVQFIERDWETFAAASDSLKGSALSGLLLYGALFLTVAAVCAFVYAHQRAREIAIARALGMPAAETLLGSFAPYALLAAVGIFAGSLPCPLHRIGADRLQSCRRSHPNRWPCRRGRALRCWGFCCCS